MLTPDTVEQQRMIDLGRTEQPLAGRCAAMPLAGLEDSHLFMRRNPELPGGYTGGGAGSSCALCSIS